MTTMDILRVSWVYHFRCYRSWSVYSKKIRVWILMSPRPPSPQGHHPSGNVWCGAQLHCWQSFILKNNFYIFSINIESWYYLYWILENLMRCNPMWLLFSTLHFLHEETGGLHLKKHSTCYPLHNMLPWLVVTHHEVQRWPRKYMSYLFYIGVHPITVFPAHFHTDKQYYRCVFYEILTLKVI
jgi:hypothetical protein